MDSSQALEVIHQALLVTIELSAPIIVGTLIVGLIIAVFQAATQINEATLTFAPKLIVTAALLVFLGPWMIDQLVSFAKRVFEIATQAGLS